MSLIEAADALSRREVARPKIRSVSPIVADLIARRKALGLTQVQVAERINRPPPVIWGWEHGKSDPQLRNLENWCTALGLQLCAELK